MTASAHVLVFRPLIRLLRERGHEVEVTARDYAQTLDLLRQRRIRAVVSRTFPLEGAEEAHELLRKNALVGRAALVLDPR